MSIGFDFTWTDFAVGLGVFAVLAVFLTARYFIKRAATDEIDRRFFHEQWKKVEQLLGYGKEMNYKLAVIEADKLLDEALKSMFFPGSTMAERLKFASFKFPKLKHAWWAHGVRNHVVHDSRYVLKYGETKVVLRLFKQALKELNAL